MSDHIEDQLRQILRRKEPPPGFAERVIARLPAAASARQPDLPAPRPLFQRLFGPLRGNTFAWKWVAAAVACLMMAAGIGRYQQYQRGLEAREQLLLALEITEKKLAVIHHKVEELNRRSVLQ
jgi:hypothetical protein